MPHPDGSNPIGLIVDNDLKPLRFSSSFADMKRIATLCALVLVTACSKNADKAPDGAVATETTTTAAAAPATAPPPAAVPVAPTPTPAAPIGFDPATAPVANPTLGAWPYFSLIDGYTRFTAENKPGDSKKEFLKDVAYDRYEFFDGTKLIPVEGRLFTVRADGKGASFFQAQKTYEKPVHDLGGVTVWEGTGQVMDDRKIDFSEARQRGGYRKYDKMGVYMVRTPTREIWVEVYQPWDHVDENYWLTIVEKKALEMKAKVLPAEALKAALDATGHVALYINFDTDKTAMKAESAPIVGEVVKLLTANPTLKLTVEGHTDNAGTPPHNQVLSEGRANAVVGALMAQGIGFDRLAAKGFGQTKPVADNGTEDGRAKNRRVELVKR